MKTLITDENELLPGCFCGTRGFEIEMTLADAQSASHPGPCDADVASLRRKPQIAAQLAKFTDDQLREALREYGAWEDDELQDRDANENRALWSAACDIAENYTL